MTTKSKAIRTIEKMLGGQPSFGEMIRATRQADNISQVNLAKKMKISKSYLCDVEKGRRLVSISQAAHFSKAMGYPPSLFVNLAIDDQLKKAKLKMKVEVKAA